MDWSKDAAMTLNLNLGYVNAVRKLESTAQQVHQIVDQLLSNKYLSIELIKKLDTYIRAINDLHWENDVEFK